MRASEKTVLASAKGIVDRVKLEGAEEWIRTYVEPVGVEEARERPWSTVIRVSLAAGGAAWFKACSAVQAFEPRLSAVLFSRWPGRVGEVIAYDEQRAWLLLRDAGTPLRAIGNPPEAWLTILPSYAELQRGEATHATDHLQHGVPDLRIETLPARFEDVLRDELPLASVDVARLRAFLPTLAQLCAELKAADIPASIQHDDLHFGNVFVDGDVSLILDWGDASISHPFASAVVAFRFLEEQNGLAPGSRWFRRLRDAYLEPWGLHQVGTFELAQRAGIFAHVCAWARQRSFLSESERADFDQMVLCCPAPRDRPNTAVTTRCGCGSGDIAERSRRRGSRTE